MKKYDICILEDELPAALALEQDIRQYCPQAGAIRVATSLQEGVSIILNHQPDIVMLDIKLGRQSGFELFEYFQTPTFETIMVTAYESYALSAIKVQVADYLLKPVTVNHLRGAFERAVKRLERSGVVHPSKYPSRMAIPAHDRITLIDVADLMYCAAQGNYCWLFMQNGDKLLASATLGTVANRLDPALFIRIHQSYVVSIDRIQRYIHGDGGTLELANGTALPVSRGYKKVLLDYLKWRIIR